MLVLPSATMSGLLLTMMGVSMGLPYCPSWREIVPCTCRMDTTQLITIKCNNTESYDQVVQLLNGHFQNQDRVSLKLFNSSLEDLPLRSFRELNMTIENLNLNHDRLGQLSGDTFEGLNKVVILSLADNYLGAVPEHLWSRMPRIRTIDLGRTGIKSLSSSNFKGIPVETVILPGNAISQMDEDTFPKGIRRLHLARNNLKTLNRTLVNLSNLMWLFANSNELTDIEGELPVSATQLQMIHFSHNKIQKFPQQLKSLVFLDSIFFQNNHIESLDGALRKLRRLKRVVLEHNFINTLTPEDFAETGSLESLLLGNNRIASLNNSLLNLKNMTFLNLTVNKLEEFSFQEIVGLRKLKSIDLSYNEIRTLNGPATNLIEWNIKLTELKLDHNKIESLNGALSGLSELRRLNLSANKLKKISPDDLIGLDQLQFLDVSHNYLTTLEETSKTFLPRLEELDASHNSLTILERDFDGLPVLCKADFSNNQIAALGRHLVSKTRCKFGHEGTWEKLKIVLQDNPILCDAALPEIMSAFEINDTRISGETHCTNLSDQSSYPPESTMVPAIISHNQANYQTVQVQDIKIDQEQLVKLASDIEKLRTRVDQLASQNKILLENQLGNRSTEKPPREALEESRKP